MTKRKRKTPKPKSTVRAIEKPHGQAAETDYLPWFVVRDLPSRGIARMSDEELKMLRSLQRTDGSDH